MKAALALVVAATSGIVLTRPAAEASTPTPKRLYTTVLTTPYTDSELPDDFFSAKVSLSKPSKKADKYHIVGEVEVNIDGPDPDDAIAYYIFRAAGDARADLKHPDLSSSRATIVGKVPGYNLAPSVWMTGSITGKNAFGKTVTNGITVMAVAKANVIVIALTDSADNQDSGNTPAAVALLKSGVRHLETVQARLGHR